MPFHSLLFIAIAVGLAVLVPLVLIPWILDRRGDLPYNAVASRLLAWTAFAALILAATTLGPISASSWDLVTWILFVGAIAFAAWWDIRDLRRRRIPGGRHPDR